MKKLYGGWAHVPQTSRDFYQTIFDNGDYEAIYNDVLESERDAREALLEVDIEYRGAANSESMNNVIAQAKRIRGQE